MRLPRALQQPLLLLACAALVARTATGNTPATYDPAEFVLIAAADPTENITYTVGLPSSNFDVVLAELTSRSTPGSLNYGSWMGQADVLALTAASDAVRAEVTDYLKSYSVSCVNMLSGLSCTASVAAVNAMHGTTLATFAHLARNGVTVKRHLHRIPVGGAFSMPPHLAGKMVFVSGLYDFPTRRMRRGTAPRALPPPPRAASTRGGARARMLVTPDYYVTPESLAAVYATTAVHGTTASIIAPAEFQGDASFKPSDLSTFASQMGVPTWTVPNKHGTFTGSDLESTLDEQYMGSVGTGLKQYFWTEPTWMVRKGCAEYVLGEVRAIRVCQLGWSDAPSHISCVPPLHCPPSASQHFSVVFLLLYSILFTSV